MFNSSFYNSMKIFIASPSDVKNERQAVDEIITEVDRVCRSTMGLRLECLRWEDLPPMTPTIEDGQIQDVIIRDLVSRCHVFILILNKRYGTVTAGQTESNTEREINVVMNMIEKKKSVMLLTYFRQIPKNADPGEQENKVQELKKRLEKRELFYQVYKNLEDFRQKLTHDLYFVAMRFQIGVTKQRSLRAFWDLGSIEEKGTPRLSIIYPPLDRSQMEPQEPDQIWLERLVPNVVFEDFKAISKIEKTLRFIGHHQIMTYASKDFPHDVYDMNRVWICLPRNYPALKQMEAYREEAWFKFIPRHVGREGYIQWRTRASKEFITIQSPLSKYLLVQRTYMSGGEWSPNLGRIVAKDYAILARFSDKRETGLKDYFLAGIRGLGTWGAGWFIDRRYKSFLKWENREDAPIQLLLEVIYKNEHIHEVNDVSNMPLSYFENENDINTIKKCIQEGLC